jgi:Ca2+-binding RTX toxin-like protein
VSRRLLVVGIVGPLVLLAVGLTACGPRGGQVSVAGSGATTHLVFVAASGKANDVRVRENGATVLVDDAGDAIVAGSGCTSVDSDTASCTRPEFITMNLGDQDDEADNFTDIPSNLFVVSSGARGIQGGPGTDVLHGGTVADLLIGDEGDDILNGNGGDDVLQEGTTTASTDVLDVDTYNGGDGSDIGSYSAASQGLLTTLDGVANDGRSGEGDNVKADVEHLIGGNAPDSLRGNANANVLRGGGGGDTLIGNEGSDSFFGEGGNDLFIEGGGSTTTNVLDADTFLGGEGTDRARYFSSTAGVRVDIDGVADDGRLGEGDNVRTDVEDVDGGQAGDTLVGDGDANRLSGQAGDDALEGNAGPDVLSGGAGFDKLDGGTESDDCDVGPDGGLEENCEI